MIPSLDPLGNFFCVVIWWCRWCQMCAAGRHHHFGVPQTPSPFPRPPRHHHTIWAGSKFLPQLITPPILKIWRRIRCHLKALDELYKILLNQIFSRYFFFGWYNTGWKALRNSPGRNISIWTDHRKKQTYCIISQQIFNEKIILRGIWKDISTGA